MELLDLEVSKWSINIESYFGDVYINHQTWIIVLSIVAVLRIAKLIRKYNTKKMSDDYGWDN
jgi:hypothetical protein